MPSRWKDFDAAGDHAPDLNSLAVLGDDVGVSGIGRLQLGAAQLLVELLHCELTIHRGDDDMFVAGALGAVDHQDVLVRDTQLYHGKATGAHEVGGLGVGHQDVFEVDALAPKVFGRGGESRFDLVVQQLGHAGGIRAGDGLHGNQYAGHMYSIFRRSGLSKQVAHSSVPVRSIASAQPTQFLSMKTLPFKHLLAATFATALVLIQAPAWAWGAQGHQVIAGLASEQLTPEARKQVDRLLALEPGATLITVSTWADETRNPATAAWHYVNFPRDSCSYDANRDCPDGKCVVGAIEAQTAILKSDPSDEKRLLALKYLVHLMGDVHQPLHAGYLDDKGGNTYQLQVLMRGTNLHALWDSGMIRQLEEDGPTMSKRLLAKSLSSGPKGANAARAAEESCKIVGMPGYYPERKVTGDYFEQFTPIMEVRLALAGARLAELLNKVLVP